MMKKTCNKLWKKNCINSDSVFSTDSDCYSHTATKVLSGGE